MKEFEKSKEFTKNWKSERIIKKTNKGKKLKKS
jgi:hypothetical protein